MWPIQNFDLLKKEIQSSWHSKSFFEKLTSNKVESKNENERVVSPESVSIYLKGKAIHCLEGPELTEL